MAERCSKLVPWAFPAGLSTRFCSACTTPFVLNTREEIARAVQDYRRTRFGGRLWPSDDPEPAREEGRFAKHADGKVERA